ncbi:hypothetical protein EIO60_01691|nr:hypothetical protein [Candidatus Pantoea persica]
MLKQGKERISQSHHPGDGSQQAKTHKHCTYQAEATRAGLLMLGKFRDDQRKENNTTDAQNHFEDGQRT